VKIEELMTLIKSNVLRDINEIIAIGGCSTIDSAKILSVLLTNTNFILPKGFKLFNTF
jgi:alcohol dehydrogenase class IV